MDNVIKGDFLKRPHTIFKTELLIVLCIGILFTIILAFTNAIWSGLALVVALVGYFYFDRYFWFNRGTWESVSYWKIADAISPADSLNNKNILSEE